MQGYISGITKLKNEDLIVSIITSRSFLTLYRFYGARHSIIQIGRKIDFEIEYCGVFMPKMRNIIQLGFKWESDFERLFYFQEFLKLLNAHLRDTDELPSFYFDLLNDMSINLIHQNPRRILVDSYAKLLEFEGRKMLDKKCFVCEGNLGEFSVVVRGFLLAHKACIPHSNDLLQTNRFLHFLTNNRGILLENNEIKILSDVVLLGL